MTKTIGNPLSWSAQGIGVAGSAMADALAHIGGSQPARLEIRQIDTSDIREALRKGREDVLAFRTELLLAIVFYPLVVVLMVGIETSADTLPLIFPVLAGLILFGPLAAVGLYEMSRKRELGQEVSWADAFGVLRSPSVVPLALLGLVLLFLFFFWVAAATVIYDLTIGPEPPHGIASFVSDVFGTAAGWTMIVLGIGVGAVFACVVLAISVVSFPLLLERNVGLVSAVVTSVRVTLRNPDTVLSWGMVVDVSLLLGALPFLLGLIVVMPVLGHATWHLYRAAVKLDGRDEETA